jgi:hypothetical protein
MGRREFPKILRLLIAPPYKFYTSVHTNETLVCDFVHELVFQYANSNL